MWSYYGSKSKIVDLYPPPKYDRIIEPFAGSARYSLKYWQKDVLLVDKYEVIVKLWQWLQQCSPNDILKLPELKVGQSLDDFNLTQEEKWLVGFIIKGGNATPCKKYSGSGNFGADQKDQYKRIAANLFKIKHWTIQYGHYHEIPNFPNVTWFIDPPYQFGGHKYRFSNKLLNFLDLAEWCKNREGQVIVCENTKADWLPFKPVTDLHGAMFKTVEAIWSNHVTNYDNEQGKLF